MTVKSRFSIVVFTGDAFVETWLENGLNFAAVGSIIFLFIEKITLIKNQKYNFALMFERYNF